jgi:hypothetical protein
MNPPTIQQKEELRILPAKFSFPEDAHKILEWLISDYDKKTKDSSFVRAASYARLTTYLEDS